LNLPLFDGFRKENRIKKINDEIKIIKKQDYLIKTNLKKNLSNILNDLSRIQDKIVWAEYSKNNAEKAYKKILDKYKKGLIDIISLVDFQNALLICENQIIINEYDFLNKIIELYYLLNCTTDFKDKNLLDEMWNLKKIY
jgi:outer membrane protein TolC